MKNRFNKKYYLVCLVAFFLFFSLVGLGYLTILTDLPEFGSLRVNFLNVGQGDSILIQTPKQKNILIDGGPDKSLVFKLDNYIPFYKRKINYIILTHPDKDHLVGLVEVLKRYKVDKVFLNGDKNSIPAFKEFEKTLKEKRIDFKVIKSLYSLSLEKDLKLRFLWPVKEYQDFKERNSLSIVCLLDYRDHEFLFTGDANKKVEEFIIKNNKALRADVLKAGHHGSKFSSSLSFLKRLKPEFFIISAGKNNFGHPHFRVLDNAKKINAKILQTSKIGDIIFFTKDNKLFLKSN
ncbi:MAG TPA: MBL fold metallo-hydrolase [Patescibacteria group bacterium]|nr:MBL fold metallo-hydrolase [Patescibacteria group bacterium]